MKNTVLNRVKNLVSTIELRIFEKTFEILVEYDKKTLELLEVFDDLTDWTGVDYVKGIREWFEPRVYIQLKYLDKDVKTGEIETWKSGKIYLTEHMTDDEIVKQTWGLFERCVKHEMMEGYTVEGKRIFNPHVNYKELMKVCDNEITR